MRSLGIVTFAFLIVGLLISSNAYAAFDLSVTPYEGGYDLRFGKVRTEEPRAEKELTIEVTTDLGKQYQVVQSLIEPLTNAQGSQISPSAFVFYTLRGSNTQGTLGQDSESVVSSGPSILYTSADSGESDSFVVVYGLNPGSVTEPGLYRGRIAYSLEPIGYDQSPVMVNLNVSAEIEISPEVEMTVSTGGKTIELRSPARGALPPEVNISIRGYWGGQYRVLQVVKPLISMEGERLREGVYFSLKGGKKGVLAQTGKAKLKEGSTLVYTSDSRGSEDELTISFDLGGRFRAGRYRGEISYYIESPVVSGKEGLIDTFQLNVDIEPIFDLEITPEAGGTIEFRGLKFGKVQETGVAIQVETNLGRAYQVSQKVSDPLTNKMGMVIPEGYFKFHSEAEKIKGTLKQPSKSPVKPGETVLYISNKEGGPDKFVIIYELSIPRSQRAGSYTTGITYSLSEIEVR